jgi:hypothetical protein
MRELDPHSLAKQAMDASIIMLQCDVVRVFIGLPQFPACDPPNGSILITTVTASKSA